MQKDPKFTQSQQFKDISEHLKSMQCKFLQDIHLEYFVIFRASWLEFGTDTAQPFQYRLFLLNVSVVFVK